MLCFGYIFEADRVSSTEEKDARMHATEEKDARMHATSFDTSFDRSRLKTCIPTEKIRSGRAPSHNKRPLLT